jgi:peptide/nickel transport system substrate-binding protein
MALDASIRQIRNRSVMPTRRQALRAGATTSLGVLAFTVACGGSSNNSPSTSSNAGSGTSSAANAGAAATTAAQPTVGGTLALVGQDPPGWDVQKNLSFKTQTTASWVYSKLTRFSSGQGAKTNDFSPTPDLAEKWETPDANTYVFHLRQNVKWHNKPPVNGRAFEASDVKYTFDRFLTLPENAQKYFFEDLDRVEAPDKSTIKFTTKAPSAVILDNTASPFVWMLPHEVAEKYNDFNTSEAVIGTGPWMLDSYQPNVRAVFKRNPDYFLAGKPYIQEVQWPIIADPSAQFAAFVSNKLDVLGVPRERLDELTKSKPDARIEEYAGIGGLYVYMNTQNPPFNDKRVRQALSMAVDRAAFIKGFNYGKGVFGTAVPADITPWSLDYKQQGDGAKYYNFDPAEAKKLLTAAGFPNGLDTTMIGYAYSPAWVEQAEWLVDSFKKIGVNVKMQLMEYAAYLSTAYGGNLTAMGWEPSTPYTTIDDYLFGVYHSQGGKNQSRVKDPQLDPMLVAQRRATDPAERKRIIDNIQKYLADAVYMNFVSYPINVTAYQARLKNAFAKGGYDTAGRFLEASIAG